MSVLWVGANTQATVADWLSHMGDVTVLENHQFDSMGWGDAGGLEAGRRNEHSSVPPSPGANPCEHAGKCLNTLGSFECQCLQGYTGPRCEIDVNECISNPCQNDATCLDQIGEFQCICMPGMSYATSHHRGCQEQGAGE